MCTGWERLNNMRPLVNTCETMCWFSNVRLIFFKLLYLKITCTLTQTFCFSISVLISSFYVKYLVITLPEYDGSSCFEVMRQNGFAPDCMHFEMPVGENRASRSSELHNTKSSLYLSKYVLETFTFSGWSISLSYDVVTGRLL